MTGSEPEWEPPYVLADHNSGGLATSDIPLRLCAAILRAKEREG